MTPRVGPSDPFRSKLSVRNVLAKFRCSTATLWVPFGAAEVGCGWPVVGLHAQLSVYGKENHLSTADSWALRGSVKETDRR